VNLIILEPGEVDEAGGVILRDARAAHLRNVLKVTAGQSVRIGLLDGPLGTAIVTSLESGYISMRCAFESTPPGRPRVDLLLALPRPKVLRRLWAQLAALGVGQIILTNAERVERNYFDTHVLTPACYRPLLIEGLQQARDTCLPAVSIHRQFRVLVEDHLDFLVGEAVRLAADPRAATTARDAVRAHRGRVLVAVGPEGGWNEFELRMLEQHGFELVGMGRRTLRTDTACISLLGTVHDALDPETSR
jgi:RsmE family RNA methyltransferase